MTPINMIALVNAYDNIISEFLDDVVNQGDPQIMHLSTMLHNIIDRAEKSQMYAEPEKSKHWDRANRDLGFVRGVLWCRGILDSGE
jgi:hypothetical protein